MKTRSILLGAILMAAITPPFAQAGYGAQGTKMDQGTHDMPMGKNVPRTNQSAQGTGVIEAIDTAKGTVTIKHQAIASIRWPAMTMTFKADPPGLLKNITVGEKVNFTLHPIGMNSTVTAIAPAK